MAQKHPKGLIVLALANMGERFGYYTMIAILTLYLQAKFGFSSATTGMIYGAFLGLIYLLPVIGGVVADKWLGYGKTILIGISIMFGGYALLGLPLGNEGLGIAVMAISLILISAGTGLFKGNVQALVGKIYDNPLYSKNRDIAFSIFYMFINIGAFFAPSMGNYITKTVLHEKGFTYNASIPTTFVKTNNVLVDSTEFISKLKEEHASKYEKCTTKEWDKFIEAEKKDAGVRFAKDSIETSLLLKLYGLNQYTKAGYLKDNDSLKVTDADVALWSSKKANEQDAKAKLKERVANAVVPAGLCQVEKPTGDFSMDFGKLYVNESLSVSYSLAFFVACISLVISILIFLIFKKTWKMADITVGRKAKGEAIEGEAEVKEMPAAEVKERLIALGLVFTVVIFFWMAFHQNGLTMTFFARDYTADSVSAMGAIPFSLFMLVPFIAVMYGIYLATFGVLGGDKNPIKGLVIMALGIAGMVGGYFIDIKPIADHVGEYASGLKSITPQIFQQFNPFFIILLTPVTVGIFSYLANKDKEPSAPRKIGIGMVLAALGFSVLMFASFGLTAPGELNGGVSDISRSPNVLIGRLLLQVTSS